MEPVWQLSESVSLSTEFSLTESFTLTSAADDWLWTDFLSTPMQWLGRRIELSGRLTLDQRLEGRLTLDQRLEGDA